MYAFFSIKRQDGRLNFTEFIQKYQIQLNEQQLQAVQATEGPVLLLAVPGSGKTTVLVSRLGYMIYCLGIRPESILTVTYTVAATNDMRRRFARIFGEEDAGRLEFRTINGISQKVLQYFAYRTGKTPFQVADKEAAVAIKQSFLEVTGKYATENDIKETQLDITYAKNMRLTEQEIREMDTEVDKFPEIFKAYNTKLRRMQMIDYDDQMIYALRILEQYPEVLSHFRGQYRYFCVDEAQDTSKIQHDMIDLLSAESRNLFMVGDEDQSIYGFRAAYPQALVSFETRHPGARVLLMETNYRSRQEIVRASDALIQKNRNRHPKKMTASRTAGGCVTEIKAVSRQGQYNYLLKVAEDCEQETAILYRNHESALPIIDMLERKGMPYRMKSSDMTFFSHPVVNDICDFIHLSLDPWDSETFLRIYYKMGAGISKKAAMEAVDANTRRLTLLDTVAEMTDVSAYTRKQCKALATHLDNMRYESAGKAIYRILNYMGYQEYMETHSMDSGKAEILKVLGEREESLFEFPVRLQKLQEMVREGCGDLDSKLVLSTIHSSKGLEYDRVYLADMLAGVLPAQIPPKGSAPDSPEVNAYEEERRLYYVGMTRAKEQLYLFTFDPNLTSVFSKEVLGQTATEKRTLQEKPRNGSLKSQTVMQTPAYAQKNSVRKLSAAEVERTIAACVSGCKVQHQKYGTGTLLSRDDKVAEILFEGENTPRKISLPIAVSAGILRAIK